MQQVIDLAGLEAEGGKIDAKLGQLAGFQRQQLLVPAGALGELVVGEHQRPLLRRGEMGELDHRHLRQPELARRQQPAVPGDDAVLAVDQHRVGEAELADRAGDQRHLRLAVGAGIAGVGDERIDRAVLEAQPQAGEAVEVRSDGGVHARATSGGQGLSTPQLVE